VGRAVNSEIDSRYPLWDQPDFMAHVDNGQFHLPDAEEGRRETLVTTTIDAEPVQCLRVGGNTFVTLYAALSTGGFFIFATFHWWWLALASGLLALATIVRWLWWGTGAIPEKATKDIGLGVTVPIYVSGSASVGWWAMLITMLGDLTAFVSLVFGYFFYWTARPDFPPDPAPGPGLAWPGIALLLLVGAWTLTVLARRWNQCAGAAWFHGALVTAVILAMAGSVALLAGPWATNLDARRDAYGATVWILVIWTAFHIAVGVIMQLYCLARRLAGRMTARHDMDIVNVTLYWHFAGLTAAITVAVIAGFPLVS
jgi:cytochrome c oxidase subunit I+III